MPCYNIIADENEKELIQPPTPIKELKVGDDSFATLILADTDNYVITEATEEERYRETA